MKPEFIHGLVSVIIPAYNAERYIAQSIRSVLSQTYSNLEIIVVDDGSTDRTPEIVRSFGNKVLFLQKPNGGPASARNFGISYSHGEYIAFLDADDSWFREKIAKQIAFLNSHRECGMVHSNYFYFTNDAPLYPRYIHRPPPRGWIFNQLFKSNLIGNLTVVVRKSLLNQLGGFDESPKLIALEDYELWLRISKVAEIGYIHSILAAYRVHQSNLWTPEREMHGQLCLIRKLNKDKNISDTNQACMFSCKLAMVHYQWACTLMERRDYRAAAPHFRDASKESSLRLLSLIGLLSCKIGSNQLFKSRRLAMEFKQHARFQKAIGCSRLASHYLMMSVRNYPLQRILFSWQWIRGLTQSPRIHAEDS